jgi:septal ring factor EnvC (AmiA/AmiB activator)
MTTLPAVRRSMITLGVILSLFAAGATVRAASEWAASSAPLNVAPASVESLQQALQQEQARSAALEAELTQLRQAAADLSSGLATAQDRASTDQATAESLRQSLDAAQAKLAKLQAALAKASTVRVVTTTTTSSSGSGATYHDDGGSGGDD